MSKRQPFVIAGETFTTKAALQARIREILHRYPERVYLAPSDFAFMLDVLKRHPDYEQKAGEGVQAMYVQQNPVYTSTRNFWLVRDDGSETDFSYLECLTETPHAKRFINACRVAVEPAMQGYKRNVFLAATGPVLCPFTGEELTYTTAHVDHETPRTFQALVDGFIATEHIDVASVKINGKAEDGVFQDTFDDPELHMSWVAYHYVHARLRLVSRTANLSILRKGPR